MSARDANPWKLADWQRDLVETLPDEQREPVVNAFYYFDVVGSSPKSFFTHLLVLLGAAKHWSENFPRAIARESDQAVERMTSAHAQFLEKLGGYATQLHELTEENVRLQNELSRNQRQLNSALNSVWTRIASQLSNRKFIQDLGEDLAQVLISNQDRIKPQIEESYRKLEEAVAETTDHVRKALDDNAQHLTGALDENAEYMTQTLEASTQEMHERWGEVLRVIEEDIKASTETKLEVARAHRDLRRYALEIDQFSRRTHRLVLPAVIVASLVVGFAAGWWFVSGRVDNLPTAAQLGELPGETTIRAYAQDGNNGEIVISNTYILYEKVRSSDNGLIIPVSEPPVDPSPTDSQSR